MSYPDPLPARIPFVHEGTVSSSGKKTTTGANEVVALGKEVNSLEFTAHEADTHIKLGDETNSHLIEAGSSKLFDNLLIESITIVESGAVYSYSGGYFR
jgi:hypothetical protein